MKKGGLSTGDVAALYKYKNAFIDVKVDTESNVGSFFLYLKLGRNTWIFWFIVLKLSHYILWFQILTTITFTEILPSTKTIASFKLPDYNSGKVSEFLFARVSNQIFTCKFKLKLSVIVFPLFAGGGSIFS